MAARKFGIGDIFYKETQIMKVELTKREIDLIVSLIDNAATGDFDMVGPIYSAEEQELVNKLEDALKKEATSHLKEGIVISQISDLKH